MPDAHVIAGDCTTTFQGDRSYEKRGRVVCVRKPDDTVLVHDASGYRPVAWLTRPEATVVAGDPPTLEARDDDSRLRVLFHAVTVDTRVPVSAAGEPVGPCPDCAGALVRRSGTLACTDCDHEHGLPDGTTVLADRCDCGLPRIEVTRGERFEACTDRSCDPLDPKVEVAFDRAFDCPDCGDDLRVVRAGGLFLGCDDYPDCEVAFSIPQRERAGPCDCGLPAFEAGRWLSVSRRRLSVAVVSVGFCRSPTPFGYARTRRGGPGRARRPRPGAVLRLAWLRPATR